MDFVKTYDGPVLTAQQATYTINPGEQIPAGSVLVAAMTINGPNDTTVNPPDASWIRVPDSNISSGGGIILAVFVKGFSSAETASYTFTNSTSASRAWQGGMALYSGGKVTDPVNMSEKFDATAIASTSIDLPALASPTTVDGCIIIRIAAISNGTTTATIGMPATERDEWISGGSIGKRPVAISDSTQATAGSVAADSATSTAASTASRVGVTIALNPMPIETLRPTSIRNLTNMTGTVTDIDEDPDVSNGADPLVATDPAGATGQTNGPEFVDGPASATAWSGGTGASWGTYANVIDQADANASAVTLAATNTDYQNFFSFAAGDWTDIPSGAVITGVSVTIRSTIGTANRVQHHIALASANGTLIGAEKNVADNTAATTTTLPASTNTEKTVNGFSAVPTRAQLVTGTFGIRLRQRRSNTSTIDIYSIKATVTYTNPGSDIDTHVEVLLANPIGTLATGVGTGEIRVAVNRKGTPDSGAGNPTARFTIHENGSATELAEVIAATSITSGASVVLFGTFNQNVITNKDNVEVWFDGNGVAGATVELDAVEWNAQVVSGSNITRTITDAIGITDTPVVVKSVVRAITDALGITDTASKGVDRVRIHTDSLGITDSASVSKGKSFTVSDTLGITDSSVRLLALARSITDALGITDSTATVRQVQRSITDTLGITDSRTLVKTISRGITDSLGITDNIVLAKGLAKVVSDTLSVSDSTLRATDYVKSVTDSLGITDSASKQLLIVITRTMTDNLGITDNRVTNKDVSKILTDNLGITDIRVVTKVIARSINDVVGITDNFSKTMTVNRVITDALDVTDNTMPLKTSFIQRTVNDTVGITDSAQEDIFRLITRTINDNLGITDNVAKNMHIVRTDTIGITDSAIRVMQVARSITDNLDLIDSQQYDRDISRIINDVTTVTDSTDKAVLKYVDITDLIGLSDSVEYRVIGYTVAPFMTAELVAIPTATAQVIGIPNALAELVGIPSAVGVIEP